MIYVQPGATFEAGIQGVPTGLTGTIGVQIIDTPSGAVFLARTTTGVSENPASSGYYTRSFTAPTTSGTYSVVWDTGTVTPSTTAAEDLIVTATFASPFGSSIGPRDPFISRVDLGNKIGKDLTTDDMALAAIDAACETCRTVAEQTFNAIADEDIVLDGSGTDALMLPQLPVIDVTSVAENGVALTDGTDYALNGGGILLRAPAVVDVGWSTSYLIRNWRAGRLNVAITYSHGYAPDDLPRDVRMVALCLAERIYVQGPAVFEVLGQRQVRYPGPAMDLTNGEKLILSKYRRRAST